MNKMFWLGGNHTPSPSPTRTRLNGWFLCLLTNRYCRYKTWAIYIITCIYSNVNNRWLAIHSKCCLVQYVINTIIQWKLRNKQLISLIIMDIDLLWRQWLSVYYYYYYYCPYEISHLIIISGKMREIYITSSQFDNYRY